MTFSVADSLQNAVLCQEEAEGFVVETVRAIQKKSRDGNKLPLRALHCKKQGMRVKQYGTARTLSNAEEYLDDEDSD
ncbi:hypothetical protein CIB84_005044 [Bambusicola thoracicus]|uniref:Uncharacterized protein n=1 Tax=Bambusicola thoracicus TaxID=9083 RepID=A0A2P4T4B5_BAMTH|nr:hypothetical protein CIB84_005044 [Bambusicola thoracicus]